MDNWFVNWARKKSTASHTAVHYNWQINFSNLLNRKNKRPLWLHFESVKPGIVKTFTSRTCMKFHESTKWQSRHDQDHLASYYYELTRTATRPASCWICNGPSLVEVTKFSSTRNSHPLTSAGVTGALLGQAAGCIPNRCYIDWFLS